MPTPKQEFQRLRNEINDTNNAHIIFYKNKTRFEDPTFLGYTCYEKKPPLIVLRKGKDVSYRYLIQILLHEYGHILDSKKNTKRFLESKLCDYCSLSQTKNVPAKTKRAVLQTEYIAERKVKTLLKRFNVKLDDNQYTEEELNVEAIRAVLVYKYQMKYGKPPSNKKRKELTSIAKKNTKMTKKELFNLNNI